MWRSWLARQIVALEAEGSNPSIHPDCQILMQICVGIFYNLYIHIRRQQTLNEEFVSAGMAELADAPDLGSGISDVQVQVLLPALKNPGDWFHRGFLC